MDAMIEEGPKMPVPKLSLADDLPPLPRVGALVRWVRGHELNRPTWRQAWSHAWPWLVVAGLLAYAGCWQGLALPLVCLTVIGALALRRPHRR